MIKALFFDIGNVLIFVDLQKMFRQVMTFCGGDEAVVLKVVQDYIDPYERGVVSGETILEHLRTITNHPLNRKGFHQSLNGIFTVNWEMLPLIENLKQKGIPLFLLSNTCPAHFEFLSREYPFLKLFDGYILSYEVGARKPEKKIFQSALDLAGTLPEESFYTDDIPEYVESAKSLGIDAVTFINPHQLHTELRKRSFIHS